MKTIIYLLCIAILIISGCNIDCTTFDSKANLNWQMKQSEKYLKKTIEIDSNKMVAFSNYYILLNIINEFEASRKQIDCTLKYALNTIKYSGTGSYNLTDGNIKNEAFMKAWSTEALNKGSVALFDTRNPQKALRNYNRGLRLMPDDESLLLLRGLCKYELGNRAGALDDWNRLKSSGKEINLNEHTARIENMKGYNELMAIMNK